MYLHIDLKTSVFTTGTITVSQLFNEHPQDPDLFFCFESDYAPYRELVEGALPRIDLVLQKKGICKRGLEIKLTALPDNTTCELKEDEYGSELVIRPDSIVYLAASIAEHFAQNRTTLQNTIGITYDSISDWTDASEILEHLPQMRESIKAILKLNPTQIPLILQPIWKTKGKAFELADNCLDIFVWSNLAFAQLIINLASSQTKSITRQHRSLIWLLKMLLDFSKTGKINHKKVIDELSYNTKNDKAFAVSGTITNTYMKCTELTTPRIKRDTIKDIILGGGQLLLSPERRFDSIIVNTPNLF